MNKQNQISSNPYFSHLIFVFFVRKNSSLKAKKIKSNLDNWQARLLFTANIFYEVEILVHK